MEEDPKEKEEEEESSSSSSSSYYSSSPIHQLILLNDLPRLRRLLSSSLPKLLPPSQIHTPSDSLHELHLSSQASALLDHRNRIPNRDTPLHLAVRLNSPPPILRLLLVSGADPSLQNASGWTPLQLSLCLRRPKPLSLLLLRHHRTSAYAKFRRRLPLLLDRLAGVPDFYMELSFRFESSLIPFLSAVAPSDVYRCWKRGVDLRVDTTLAGFDGLRVRRADQSFVFSGSAKRLVVLDRGRKQARDAFQGLDEEATAAAAVDDGEEDGLVEDASAYRPGLDITRAELVKVKNWRGKERVESVGEWRAKAYEVKDVVFSFKTMKAAREEEERLMELELDEDAEDGFLVAEIPPMPPPMPARRSCYERGRFGGVDAALPPAVGVAKGRRSLDVLPEEGMRWEKAAAAAEVEVGGKIKEKELVKSLRPMVWLTEDFPLKTEELIPILDILANKVKAVRRLRELLTTKFPPGTFPVKVSIPIVPTVRVIVTFTKFVNLQPSEEFFTPLSSPRHLGAPEDEEHRKAETGAHKSPWLRWSNSSAPKPSVTRPNSVSPSQVVNHVDPFSIPSDYTWVSMKDESKRAKKARSRKGN